MKAWSLAAGALLLLLAGAEAGSPEGRVVLEDFQTKEADGFPTAWQNESGRNAARARQAYRVEADNGTGYLAVRNADQRIKKKQIEWHPKMHPVITWRWRLHKAPSGADPIAVVYVALDTDLLFIPVFTKYVWSATKPAGTVSEGGMFSGSEVVLRTGSTPTAGWVEERVNAYEDFKRIHGHEPADKAWGISLLAGPGVDIDIGPFVAEPR